MLVSLHEHILKTQTEAPLGCGEVGPLGGAAAAAGGGGGGGVGSEGLALRVLSGADGAVALHGHRVVVEGGDVGLAARQAHRHLTHLAVRAHAVVPVDVGRVRHGSLKDAHTHTHTYKDTHGRRTFIIHW